MTKQNKWFAVALVYVAFLGAIPLAMLWFNSESEQVVAAPELIIDAPKLAPQEAVEAAPLLQLPTECKGFTPDHTLSAGGETLDLTGDFYGQAILVVSNSNSVTSTVNRAFACIYGDSNFVNVSTASNQVILEGDNNTIHAGGIYTEAFNSSVITITGNNNTVVLFGDDVHDDEFNTVRLFGNGNQVIGSPNIDNVEITGDNNNVQTGGINDDEGWGVYDSITIVSGNGNFADAGPGGTVIDNGTGTIASQSYIGDDQDVDGGPGDDIVYFIGNKAKFDGNGGNDTVTVTGNEADIKLGPGDDTVTVTGNKAKIEAEEGFDTVTVNGDEADIKVKDGGSDITVEGFKAKIEAKDGFDTVSVTGDETDIKVENGGSNITVVGNKAKIEGKIGEDVVHLTGNEADIKTEKDNDTVTVVGNSNKIDTGDGLDEIVMTGNLNEAKGKNQNDILEVASGNANIMDGGDGTDACIDGGTATVKISCESATRRAIAPQAPVSRPDDTQKLYLPILGGQ